MLGEGEAGVRNPVPGNEAKMVENGAEIGGSRKSLWYNGSRRGGIGAEKAAQAA